MKTITNKLGILVALLAINVHASAAVPSTVDYETVGTSWTWSVFANGAAQDPSNYSVVSNPSISGINTSSNCAKFIVNPDGARWAGAWTGNNPFTVDASNCFVKIMVYKNVISPISLEFLGSGGAPDDIIQVTNTLINQWEELTFDFTPYIGHSYLTMQIMPDFPTVARTSGSINYWDNISFNSAPVESMPNIINFETTGGTWNWTVFSNGAAQDPSNFSVVSNPSVTGINVTSKCAKFIVNADAAKWAGAYTLSNPQFTIDRSNYIVKVMVYKDVISPFQLEFKGNNDIPDDALQVSNTLINQWEELTFDFTPFIGHTYTTIVVIPDFPSVRNYSSTNYWDNISFSGTVSEIKNVQQKIIDFYPNPVKDILHFKSNAVSKAVIINSIGQIIKVENINDSESDINMNEIPTGCYSVRFIMKNGDSSTQKVMKF